MTQAFFTTTGGQRRVTWNLRTGCLLELFTTVGHTQQRIRRVSHFSPFLHAAGWTGQHPPVKIWCELEHYYILAPLHIELCWVMPPSKGQTVKYCIILPHTGTKLVDEQIYCQLWGSLVLLSPFAKQHRVHKQATGMSLIIIWIYFHCHYNGLQSMSSPLQMTALNSVLMYVPEALISPRLIYEYGGGWLVWVEAIDSMYLKRCQPCRMQTHSDGCYKKCRGGYLSL